MSLQDHIDILILRLIRWWIKRGWGDGCGYYEQDCVACRAGNVVKWLDEQIESLLVV